MSQSMITKAKSLWKKFSNRRFREAFASSRISTQIAAQIQTLREERGWTQDRLAQMTGMAQSRISLLEDPSYERVNISTLKRIASAFDVAISIRFVAYSDLLATSVKTAEVGYSVKSFLDDAVPQIGSKSWRSTAVVHSSGHVAQKTSIVPSGKSWNSEIKANSFTGDLRANA